MKPTTTLFALFAVLAFAPAGLAQPATQATAREPFRVEAGELSLSSLVDRSANHLGCNILLSPQEMAAGQAPVTVRLQHALALDRDGCEEFLTTILHRNGFALVQLDDRGAIREIVSMTGPRAREITARAVTRTVDEVLARPSLKVQVTTVFELKHINAPVAANALRPFFASLGSPVAGATLTIGNVGNESAMLLSGTQDLVAQAIRLLQRCDTPPPPETITKTEALMERIAQLEQRLRALEQKSAPQQAR